MRPVTSESAGMFDRKLGGKCRDDVGLTLHHLLHPRALRPATQFLQQSPKLCRPAARITLHPTVAEICGVASDAQPLGHTKRKIAVTHALHPARNVNAPGFLVVGHVIQEGSSKTASAQ